MKKLDPRVLKLVCAKITEVYTPKQINDVLSGLHDSYPNMKRDAGARLLATLRRASVEDEVNGDLEYKSVWKITELFLDSLNLNGKEEETDQLASEIDLILRTYTQFSIPEPRATGILTKAQADKIYEEEAAWRESIESQREAEYELIKKSVDQIEEINVLHAEYANLIYTFATHPHPTPALNNSYLSLKKSLQEKIRGLELHFESIPLVVPFRDLFVAEHEWNMNMSQPHATFYGPITWKMIRPKIMTTQSQIETLLRIAREDIMTNDDRILIEESQKNRRNHLEKFSNTIPVTGTRAFGKNKLTFDLDTGTVKLNSTSTTFLPGTQHYKIFSELTAKYGKPVPYNNLLGAINKRATKKSKTDLRLLINEMKHKLAILPAKKTSNPNIFQTVAHVGIKLFYPTGGK